MWFPVPAGAAAVPHSTQLLLPYLHPPQGTGEAAVCCGGAVAVLEHRERLLNTQRAGAVQPAVSHDAVTHLLLHYLPAR